MIREAGRDDIADVVCLLARHHADRRADFPFPFDPALASADVAGVIEAGDGLCLVDDGCALIALAHRPLFVPERVAVEIFLRCERAGVRDQIVYRFEAWARERGCTRTALASTYAFAAFGRLYSPAGYLPAELTFAKVL